MCGGKVALRDQNPAREWALAGQKDESSKRLTFFNIYAIIYKQVGIGFEASASRFCVSTYLLRRQKVKKIFVFVIWWVASMPLTLLAGSGLPMMGQSLASGAEYARLVRAGQCNGSCDLVAQALVRGGYISSASIDEAVRYLENLEVQRCPGGAGPRKLSAVWGTNLGNITRPYRVSEMCFRDRNSGRIVASADCGNIDLQGGFTLPEATPQPHGGSGQVIALRGEPGLPGRDGIDGRDGVDGRDGIDGRDGRDGVTHVVHVPLPPQGGVVGGYGGYELARDLGHDLVWGWVVDSVTKTIVRGKVRREELRTRAQVEVAYWASLRGPSSVTNTTITNIAVAGDCNNVMGGSVHCIRNPTPLVPRPQDPPPVVVPPPPPPVVVPPPPPVFGDRPRPQEPVFGDRPRPQEPVFGDRPRPQEPVPSIPPVPDLGSGSIGPRPNPNPIEVGGGEMIPLPGRNRPRDPTGG